MKLVDIIPFGEANKILAEDLARRFGCKTTRELRQNIESARNDGGVICATDKDGGGYFRPITISELRRHVITVDNRAKSTLRSNSSARTLLQTMESQENSAGDKGR